MPELACPLQSTPVQSYVHHSMPSPITYHKATSIHHKTIYLIFDDDDDDDDDGDDDDDKPCAQVSE